jgi:hypothetical protein
VFLVWNATGTIFSKLNTFNMPKNLIKLWFCLLWFNGFPLTSLAPQSNSGEKSYGSLKLDGSEYLPSIVCVVTFS